MNSDVWEKGVRTSEKSAPRQQKKKASKTMAKQSFSARRGGVVTALLLVVGLVACAPADQNQDPSNDYPGAPDTCKLIPGSCGEAGSSSGGGAGGMPSGASGSGGLAGSAQGGAGGSGFMCPNGQLMPREEDCPQAAGGTGGTSSGASGEGGSAGSPQAGQGGASGAGQSGAGGSAAGVAGESGSGGAGGTSSGASGEGGSAGSPQAGQGGAGAGGSDLAGAGGASGAGQSGAGGSVSGSGGESGSSAGGAGQGGAGQGGSGEGGSDPAGAGGASGGDAGSAGSPQAGAAGQGGAGEAGVGGSGAGQAGAGGQSGSGAGGAGASGAGGSGGAPPVCVNNTACTSPDFTACETDASLCCVAESWTNFCTVPTNEPFACSQPVRMPSFDTLLCNGQPLSNIGAAVHGKYVVGTNSKGACVFTCDYNADATDVSCVLDGVLTGANANSTFAIDGTDDQSLWVVGRAMSAGAVWKRVAGVWTKATGSPKASAFSDMRVTPDGAAYVFGWDTGWQKLWRVKDGVWIDLGLPQPAPKTVFKKILVLDESHVYIVGMDFTSDGQDVVRGRFLSYNGTKWTDHVLSPEVVQLTTIAGSSPNDLFLSGMAKNPDRIAAIVHVTSGLKDQEVTFVDGLEGMGDASMSLRPGALVSVGSLPVAMGSGRLRMVTLDAVSASISTSFDDKQIAAPSIFLDVKGRLSAVTNSIGLIPGGWYTSLCAKM